MQQDRKFLQQCLSQAVIDVFATMAGLDMCETKERTQACRQGQNELTGIMMILSGRNAVLSITMDKKDAQTIISFMTGTVLEELVDSELYDGVAELINMIAGRFKASLIDTDYHFSITPPFTIVGKKHFIVYKQTMFQITMHFQADETPIHLNLTYL
ncbi:chemotaxis protein CheX [Sporomusaceae bacterium BoRhaA]|uniref:chemotaxis protein CheX n=1 Tax=Pelorhabdus rhamnosifermentans TaxID=2772457 RepID=UPI001FE75D6F|nr:chemotaxis protein CheX [Pelorhabdus rhamnosifermentans]MBU2701805.1 chemotaxis protein CheX [Pelorhabdus rhamnosifermentans]